MRTSGSRSGMSRSRRCPAANQDYSATFKNLEFAIQNFFKNVITSIGKDCANIIIRLSICYFHRNK